MTKQRIAQVAKKIDALDLELSKLNVNDPKIAKHVADIRAELVSLHAEQDAV
jgi:uncharacterized membrane protein